ncbi:MAG TPA: aminotransferase class V-fold PLP-dependent enzyme, partial [Chloroflexota bacterium]
VARTANMARRCGARIVSTDDIEVRPTSRLFCESQSTELLVTDRAQGRGARLLVVPLIDPDLGSLSDVAGLARACHQHGVRLVVEATLGLGARELRVDDWAIDACVAGVDHALGAPSGLTLITYSSEIEAMLAARRSPPRTSYLDLIQLQAYWSPERLNHHTAPTSLVYGLREALRLLHAEGLQQRWHRHHQVGVFLRQGLEALGLVVRGEPPVCIVKLPRGLDEAAARRSLLDGYGVYVSRVGVSIWRVGLLGADARLDAAQRVLAAFEAVLSGSEATSEAGASLVPGRP